ncbi:Endonuclease/exonuclease/phosphatase [Syncephalis fuscata]|nr:Endonuclease/exonuclease/phosphatase [Syncephalis fuscata]
MKLVTWNVNGLRALFKRTPWCDTNTTLHELLENVLKADICCIQEHKMQREQLSMELAIVPQYDAYYAYARHRINYSGVATFINNAAPLKVQYASTKYQYIYDHKNKEKEKEKEIQPFSNDDKFYDVMEKEGRLIMIDTGPFILLNVYVPFAMDTERVSVKRLFCHQLEQIVHYWIRIKHREVCLVGDLNIAPTKLDHCDPIGWEEEYSKVNSEPCSFEQEPFRQWLHRLTSFNKDDNGLLVDVVRHFYPNDSSKLYTCWNTRLNSRASNFGTRIDYVLMSPRLMKTVTECNVLQSIKGSDHCPVTITLDSSLLGPMIVATPTIGNDWQALCTRYYPEYTGKQTSLSAYFNQLSKPQAQPIEIANVNKEHKTSTKRPISNIAISSLQNSHVKKMKPQQATLDKFNFLSKRMNTSEKEERDYEKQKQALSTELTLNNIYNPSTSNSGSGSSTINQVNSSLASANKEVWQQLFEPPVPPNCRGHNEPCIRKVVRKKGLHQGRHFWTCSRPIGPTNTNSNTNSEYNCNYFRWASQST